MRLAIVTIVLGQDSRKQFKIARPYFLSYANKIKAELILITKTTINGYSNHFEKFQMRNLLRDYDRILYLDCDILIHPLCPNIFDIVPETHVGGVYDNETNSSNFNNRKNEVIKVQKGLGPVSWKTGYFNSGVIVLSKIHDNLFSNPDWRYKYESGFKDQTLINYNLRLFNFPFFNLDKKFNGMQINGFSSCDVNPKTYMPGNNKQDAFIMHFANETDSKHVQMQKVSRVLTSMDMAQASVLKPTKKMRAFYDISEIGWSMYLSAHVSYLESIGEQVAVIAPKSKHVLYLNKCTKVLPMPSKFYDVYNNLPSDGNHLYDPRTKDRIKDHNQFKLIFEEAYPEYSIVTNYSKFENERIFSSYDHSEYASYISDLIFNDNKVILIFPRYRQDKFKCRNIPLDQWQEIILKLCSTFPTCIIVSIGSTSGAYNINFNDVQNYINLVNYDDEHTLDIMISLCNTKRAICAVGSQSGPPKLTLLNKTPTYMFGDEKYRHTHIENWSGTKCGFWDVISTPDKYIIPQFKNMVVDIIKFASDCYDSNIKETI